MPLMPEGFGGNFSSTDSVSRVARGPRAGKLKRGRAPSLGKSGETPLKHDTSGRTFLEGAASDDRCISLFSSK